MKSKFFFFILLMASCLARGETIHALGQTVVFSNPDDFCTVGDTQRERDLISMRVPPNAPFRIVHFAVHCTELEQYVKGQRDEVQHWYQIQLLGPNGNFKRVESKRLEFIIGVAKSVPRMDAAELTRRVNAAISNSERSLSDIQVTPLGRDDNAVYFFQSFVANFGSSRRPVRALVGITLVKSLPLSIVVNERADEPVKRELLQRRLQQVLLSLINEN
jgi:hypothetical protein